MEKERGRISSEYYTSRLGHKGPYQSGTIIIWYPTTKPTIGWQVEDVGIPKGRFISRHGDILRRLCGRYNRQIRSHEDEKQCDAQTLAQGALVDG